jgi:hypothetical protein
VAIAVSVGTLAGGTPAAGRPAGSPMINVTTGQFTPPRSNAPAEKLAATPTVTASHNFSSIQGITIQSQGIDLEGTIKIKIRTYDYKVLWRVYNLPCSSSWNVWVGRFSRDSSRSALKKALETETSVDIDIEIRFRVAASALNGVSTLRIGFETLQLQHDGTAKDFPVVNPASGGAKDQNDNAIPVDFEPF